MREYTQGNAAIVLSVFLKIFCEVPENAHRGFIYMFSYLYEFSGTSENYLQRKTLVTIPLCVFSHVITEYLFFIKLPWLCYEQSEGNKKGQKVSLCNHFNI